MMCTPSGTLDLGFMFEIIAASPDLCDVPHFGEDHRRNLLRREALLLPLVLHCGGMSNTAICLYDGSTRLMI